MVKHILVLSLIALALGLIAGIIVLILTGGEAVAPVQPGALFVLGPQLNLV